MAVMVAGTICSQILLQDMKSLKKSIGFIFIKGCVLGEILVYHLECFHKRSDIFNFQLPSGDGSLAALDLLPTSPFPSMAASLVGSMSSFSELSEATEDLAFKGKSLLNFWLGGPSLLILMVPTHAVKV